MSTAADFIWSDSPLEILGSVTSISFDDPASLPIKDHALITEEVFSYCFLALIFSCLIQNSFLLRESSSA